MRLCVRFNVLGLVAVGFGISACAAGTRTDPSPIVMLPHTVPVSADTAPEESLAMRLALPPPSKRASPGGRNTVALRKDPPTVMRPIVPAPVQSIAGLSEDDVLNILGEPQERSESPGRRVWIYAGAGCTVEVTFFRDVTRNAYAALSQKSIRADGAGSGSCKRAPHVR